MNNSLKPSTSKGKLKLKGPCPKPIKPVFKEKNLIDGEEVYTIKLENEYKRIYCMEFYKGDNHQAFEDLDQDVEIYAIRDPEFFVELIDNHTLKITMDKNTTDKENTLIIGLQAGDCFDRIKIVQPPSEE